MTQKALRQAKRDARKALTAEQKAHYSTQITNRLLNSHYYRDAQNIGVYLSLPEEVDTQQLIERAWQDKKNVFLPVVSAKGQALRFAPHTKNGRLRKDAMNIDVPDVAPEALIEATTLDMVVTPLVAFDARGYRIGMGGGFYDRTFAFRQAHRSALPYLVGIAFAVQQVEDALPQEWDIALDAVITEENSSRIV